MMIRNVIFLTLLCSVAFVLFFDTSCLQAADQSDAFQAAEKLINDGNFREALTAYRELLQNQELESAEIISSFQHASKCFQHLDQLADLDTFRESVVQTHPRNWQVLSAVAESYLHMPHHGYQIAGEFRRGRHRGGGKVMNARQRDRVRALQLHLQALQIIQRQNSQPGALESRWLSHQFAHTLMYSNSYQESWRLQVLTDLSQLPDYDEGWHHHSGQTQGAPIGADDQPVVYNLPSSWQSAKNDGERWRWALDQAAIWHPPHKSQVQLIRARFLQSQFGVETLAQYGWWFGRSALQDNKAETGTYALHTLGQNETIARLATGIRRFELPPEHNPIKIYQEILAQADPYKQYPAASALATLFENRRQYQLAVEYWTLCQQLNPSQHIKEKLDQIQANWGRFEPIMSQPAGQGATVDFRFRNGQRVEFTAHRIEERQLLEDVKSYLKKNPRKWDWQQVQLENLGHRLVVENQDKYLGKEIARWSLDLQPLDKSTNQQHFDRRITVTTPLQEPGAYLITSKMDEGNTTSIVLWLSDTAIVKKRLSGKTMYYVADSVGGQPIADCNMEFFGYWYERKDKDLEFHTKNFSEFTDANGLVALPSDQENHRYDWVATATTTDGRFAHLGFSNIWSQEYQDQQYKQVKVFTITDRPVYRPKQKVQFKFWVRHAQYNLDDKSQYAGQSFRVELHDPKNKKVFSQQLTADAYGGLEGEWQIPAEALLGQYRLNVARHGGGTFRIEEYKKPEFEVTMDTPSEPVLLGKNITTTISAKYYFGEPVLNARVKYKILRTPYNQAWYPPMPWDWLYGPGYWWSHQEYSWYPGWARWGCPAPHPWWFWRSPQQPEVVAEREVAIGPDGKVEVQIDTSLAKQFYPDQDQSYQIQAEVIDKSRRTIVGSGRVLVAHQPFRVYVWTEQGHYRVGDTIQIGCAAQTLASQPIEGQGTLRLLQVKYDNDKPVETEVGRWEVATNEMGQAKLQIKASQGGQYRLSYELTDSADNKVEGGHMVTVAGTGFDGSEFRFNDLELIPDQHEYQAGDKVSMQINTNRAGAAVLLFARPSDGIYLPPQLVKLTGKSQLVDIEVMPQDAPNFFVEAVTVHGGRVHTVTREIFVPPSNRIIQVEVVPSAKAYTPGQAAKVLLKLTDQHGNPFVGTLTLAIYDKALEYISGGSNVPGIREFFWKWRRSHQPHEETNLQRYSHAHVKPNLPTMHNLGIFGDEIARESAHPFNEFRQKGLGRVSNSRRGFSELAPQASVLANAGSVGLEDEADVARSDDLPALSEDPTGELNPFDASVRENFADTAMWIGTLETNAEGLAEAELEMPENLTTWKIRVWAMSHGTRVGEGTAEIVTRKNLILRMQAPRFFVETDEVVLSANVHNYLPDAHQIRVQLELDGDILTGPSQLKKDVVVAPGGEERVDWRVKVNHEGKATIRMRASTDQETDAMQMSFPVYVHGMLKTESFSGVLRSDQHKKEFTITVPAARRADQTNLKIQFTPSLAGAMVNALPYLIEYPYGCTEQTLNRFLPAVLTQQTLQKMGWNLQQFKADQPLQNPQELAPPAGDTPVWQRPERSPVFDDAELTKIVKAGVNRLTEMQLSDGGWGWFSGWSERSTPHTTAVVLHGLQIAQENGVAVVPSVLEQGTQWLAVYQAQQLRLLDNWDKNLEDKGQQVPRKKFADNLDALVSMVLAAADRDDPRMREYLYRDRTHLSVHSLATFGLALHKRGDHEKLSVILRNISQYVVQDDENQTAWLRLPDNTMWHWYGGEYETHAYYLKLLSVVEPDNIVASQLVKYLLNNRKHATYWKSTRDTALVVEAFADYLKTSKELTPDSNVQIWIDGQLRKDVAIQTDNLFSMENTLVLTGNQLASGQHTVEIRKQGKSPLYMSGHLTNFTLEDPISAAGLELKIQRHYYKLTRATTLAPAAGDQGQVVPQHVRKYKRQKLANLSALNSGDMVEVELVIDSKNDYEYILLEDMKAAGFEPVDIRSGYNGNSLGAYLELRDDRVSLFVARLARGKHSIAYRLRAEIPGKFSALPTRVSAMYAPELKANADEIKLRIEDLPMQSRDLSE